MEKNLIKPLISDLKTIISNYIDEYSNANKIKSGMISGLLKEKPHSTSRVKGFNIGKINISNPVISAPLAGISDNTFRVFARSFGCGLTFSEMVTSYGIHFDHKKSKKLTEISEYERPCALQLFGSEPEIMADAAKKVEDQADIIDINMGCPVPKILKAKSGGYLMQDEKRVEQIITSMVKVLKKPLTIKTRIGWNRDNVNIMRIAKIAESSGASAITIHGRTVRQGFSGNADYEKITMVKKEINIPVIVSGDIGLPIEAEKVLESTGCDGVMIGRASKGTLWLFLDILIHLALSEIERIAGMGEFNPSYEWKKSFARLYLRFLIGFKGEFKAIREFRKHLSWIFKGVRYITETRKKFFLIDSTDDALEIIDSI